MQYHQLCVRNRSPVLAFNGITACRRCRTLYYRGWEKLRTGVELDNYYFSAAAWETLKTNLPDTQFTDMTGLVNWQRAIKSETEITFIRRAAKIVEEMHAMPTEILV